MKLLRSVGRFLEWVARSDRVYWAAVATLALGFVALKLALPLRVQGSFIDEYLHILGGINLFERGWIGEFYDGQGSYLRGSYVTVLVGALLAAGGKSLFVAKLLPAAIGVVDFALAVRIAMRVLPDRKWVLLFVAVYALSPWVLFNHFYIRFYVFYELFLLLGVTALFGILSALEQSRWKRLGVLLLLLAALNLFVLATSHDQGAYLILFGSLVGLAYLFVCEVGRAKAPGASLLGRGIGRLLGWHPLVRLLILVALGGLGAVVLPVGDLLERLFHTELSATSGHQQGYFSFFLVKNLWFSILFALSVASVWALRSGRQRLLVCVGGSLLALHLLASEDLQITRALMYMLALFYLVPLIAVSQVANPANRLIFACCGVLLVSSVLDEHPRRFWAKPRVPAEIRYMNYAGLYRGIESHCSDALIVDASPSPFIARFYGVDLDYVLLSKQHVRDNPMYWFDVRIERYRVVLDGTPVCVDWRQLERAKRDICLILRDGAARKHVPGRAFKRVKKDAERHRFAGTSFYYLKAPKTEQ